MIAEKGPELAALARNKGRRIEFGAAVGGAIPILGALREELSGDRLYSIMGILNGMSNCVLSWAKY